MAEIPLEQLLKEHIISQRTYDKVIVAKNYIERRYNLQTAKNMEWNEIMNQIDSLQICQEEKQKIKKEIYNQEVVKFRKLREKQTIRDYESLAIIGRGAFGEVHVCREKKTGKIYAPFGSKFVYHCTGLKLTSLLWRSFRRPATAL